MSNIDDFLENASKHLKKLPRNRSSNLKHWNVEEDRKDIYAIMPPLEVFMDISPDRLESFVWNRFENRDIVIGRVTSKSDHGLHVKVLCFDAGKSLDIAQFEIFAKCPRSEIPKITNHENPVLRFNTGDLIRGAIIEVDKEREKLAISLHDRYSKLKLNLGVIMEENLPVAYKRSCTFEGESYNEIMAQSTGFYNLNLVNFLKDRLVNGSLPSLIDDLKRLSYPPEEYADQLRKKQSARVASEAVTKGVDLYGKGKINEALQALNHALDLDTSNVEALVARGAIYANKRSFIRAIGDFELALKLSPTHKNAKEYLVEVLVERAKSIELDASDVQQIKEASDLYKRATVLNPDCDEAHKALGALAKSSLLKKRNSSSTDSVSDAESSKTATIVKVKHLLEKEVDMKTSKCHSSKSQNHHSRRKSNSKQESSSSSSTSSDSSSSSSESSPHRKRRRVSSSSSKEKMKLSHSASKSQDLKKLTKTTPQKHAHDGGRLNKSFSSSYEHQRRTSTSQDNPNRRSSTGNRPLTHEPKTQKAVPVPITKVNKKNFESILDQISRFESKKKT